MLTKLQSHLANTDLLPPQSKLIVAVSGGVDSVALLDLLSKLQQYYGWQMVVAHYDHKVRPDSYLDAELVALAAEDRGLKYYLQEHTGTNTSEAALRKARYAFLEELLHELNYDAIVTAHHNNDRVETAIFNVVRGADRRGIVALQARKGSVVRPLLPFTKAEIITYAGLQDLPYREDSTNTDLGFSRNFVRHVLVPQGSMVYKNFHHSFTQKLNDLQRLNTQIDRQLDMLLQDMDVTYTDESIAFDRAGFSKLSPRVATNVLLHVAHALKPGISVSRKNIAQAEHFLQHAKSGDSMHLKNGLHIRMGYDTVIVTCQPPLARRSNTDIVHILTEKNPFENNSHKLSVRSHKLEHAHNLLLPKQKLLVRYRQGGDKVYPVGMKGSKKLQDVFVDKKVPRQARDTWPVVVNNANEIVWLPNLVVDRRALELSSQQDIICITCEVK